MVGSNVEKMKIPIACSLEAGEARSQLGEWKQLRRVVGRVERVSPNRLELDLLPEADIASIAAALATGQLAFCTGQALYADGGLTIPRF